jgi:RNA polymerase sigma-70 factor (ECF subfamily)
MTPISRLTLRLQSDARLVELAAGGSDPAFEAIVDRYWPPLLRYSARLLPSDRAEDVVQQTFERAYAALRDTDPPRRLRPWLYRIAHNLAVNTLEKNGWDYEQLDENYDGVPQPPDVVAQREQLAQLVNQMQSLPDRQRSALVMHVLEGHSYDEIARELSATPSMVRQLLYRARTRLRDSLGVLVPLPLLRAFFSSGAFGPGTERVAEAATGAGGGIGIAKVGVSLFAAATIAGSAGVAIQERGANHSRPAVPPAAEATQKPAPSPAQEPADDRAVKPASKSTGGEDSSHRQVAERSDGPGSFGNRDSAAERDQHQSGDEEEGGRHGRSGDRDEEGSQARIPSDEDGEHGSEDRSGHDSGEESGDGSGGESGSPESGGSGGGEGEKGESTPSAPDAPATPGA